MVSELVLVKHKAVEDVDAYSKRYTDTHDKFIQALFHYRNTDHLTQDDLDLSNYLGTGFYLAGLKPKIANAMNDTPLSLPQAVSCALKTEATQKVAEVASNMEKFENAKTEGRKTQSSQQYNEKKTQNNYRGNNRTGGGNFKNANNESRQETSEKTIVCYGCNKPGHTRATCPEKKEPEKDKRDFKKEGATQKNGKQGQGNVTASSLKITGHV